LIAGLNAALRAGGGEADFTLDRSQAYIGVMIDDLTTRGTSEPYRMFTSRAEYRLSLRADNADQRLTNLGTAVGVVGSERARVYGEKETALLSARTLATGLKMTPTELAKRGMTITQDGVARTALDLLRFPDVTIDRLTAIWPELADLRADVVEQLVIDAGYAGYLERQEADIRAFRKDEALSLPLDLDYTKVGSLSAEVRQKLIAAKPETLGAAARVPGVTPAAVIALLRHVKQKPVAA
jgi:tRNA uridine 5-carboxymethylaminomethyl modification enzyme